MEELRPLTNQDKILILSPHPDDESLATGGLIQVALEAGAQVRVLYASNGDNNPWPQRVKERRLRINPYDRFRWGKIRRAEAIDALDRLGLWRKADAAFLGFPDQGFNDAVLNLDEEPLKVLKEEIENFRPTLLFTPSLHDRHPDHNSLAVFASLALQQVRRPVERLVYLVHTNGRTPLNVRVVLPLTPAQQLRKRDAISRHATQMMLSRRWLLRHAGPVETFYKPVEPEADHAHHPLVSAHLADGFIHLRISAAEKPLRHAGPVETFYKPVEPEADHAHHPLVSAHLADGFIHLRISAAEKPLLPSKVFIAMESLMAGGRRWMLPLPVRSGKIILRDAITGGVVGDASATVTKRGIGLRIPVFNLEPLNQLFIKLKTPTLFFERTGWREVSVTPLSGRDVAPATSQSTVAAKAKALWKQSGAWSVLSLLALVWLCAILSENIRRPWVNMVDFNGAVWSQAAHNILRAGMAKTEGASTGFYFGPLPIPPAGYYLHHPPLLHLILTWMFALLGEHEWVARLLPITCSVASGILLWQLVRSCAGVRTAAFSLAIFACLPMELRYGSMVNFEPVVLMLMLGALCTLRQWHISGDTRWKTLATALLMAGMWVDWAMYMFVIVLCAWWLAKPALKMRRFASLLLASALVFGALYLLRIQILRPDAWQNLTHAFFRRIGSQSSIQFTEGQWFARVGRTLYLHFLPTGWALAIAGGILIRRRNTAQNLRWLGWASLMIAAMDIIFVGAFQNDSFIHEYIGFYFIAPVAIFGGVALNEFTEWIQKHMERQTPWSFAGVCLPCMLLLVCGYLGLKQTDAMRRQFIVLDYKTSEPPDLIPRLGEAIRENFPSNTYVLCNFLPDYGPQLGYYAQRNLLNNVMDYRYWQTFLKSPLKQNLGGIVWMNSGKAAQIVATLPPGSRKYIQVGNLSFCIWKPAVLIKQAANAKLGGVGRS